MARHIMAVCVVCLLCADHIPCQQHFDSEITAATLKSSVADDTYKNLEHHMLNARVFQRTDIPKNPSISMTTTIATISIKDEKSVHSTVNVSKEPKNQKKIYRKNNLKYEEDEWRHAQHRRKRHAGHSSETEEGHQKRPEITESFLKRIFEDYGDSVSKKIQISEFQRLLKQLGLEKLIEDKLTSPDHNNETVSIYCTLFDNFFLNYSRF